MDNRAEVREFLTSRRAKISPERAGLPAAGRRRVPGLRRSEVAALAGMSVEYYAKLERGTLAFGNPGRITDEDTRILRGSSQTRKRAPVGYRARLQGGGE